MNDTRSRLEKIQPYANLHRVAYVTTEEGRPEVEQPQPAEASTEIGAEEICRPPFSRASLAILLFSGTGMAGVIGWAVLARWAN